jgi:hypothetical protein
MIKQISEIQNDESMVARVETVGCGGEYQHLVIMGRFYAKDQLANVYNTLEEHETKIGVGSVKIITQLNSCGVNKTLIELLN